jgi:beta-glucosidase/6-phospho-beta-glucosidase/beta-galactosidase
MSAAAPPRSQLARLVEPGRFCWATGIEDTFITDPWKRTGRTLDEYELTGHYERLEEDLDLVAGLGVGAARYGIPWHRVEPAPGRFDWSFADAALEGLLARGVAPIVDLVHYGTPGWLEGAFLHADFPARVAEYAARLADRFRGRIHWYTPMNEPRIAAWYCGRLGWWPPYRRGLRGFAQVLVAACRGVAAIDAALRAVDPEIVLAHVDATDLYESDDPALAGEVALRQALVFLALDLLTGRVDEHHALRGWLADMGFGDAQLAPFRERPLALDVVGINLYPMFTWKHLVRAGPRVRVRMRYAGPELLERLGEMYWSRYRRPLFVSETASLGSVARRRAWLDGSIGAVRTLRERGVPVIGYTWWPLFALVAWSWRQGHRALERHLLRMGLYELDPRPEAALARVPTLLASVYREIAAGGDRAVGGLAPDARAAAGAE